jgi:O-antigen ligase
VSPVQHQRPNPILRANFPILVLFLINVFAGAFELLPVLRVIHLLLLLGIIGLIVIIISGRLKQVVMTPIGVVLTLFTVWFILCIPAAIWRGGSFGVFVDVWSKSYLAFVLTAGLILTLDQMRKIFHTIAYAVGFLACTALGLHQYDVTGRLGLMGTRYGNANEFGFTLLVGVVFLSFLYMQSRGFRKALAVVLMVPVLIALAKTGSRGCMLGAGVLFVYVFFHTSMRTKARMLLAIPVLLIIVAFAVPSHLRERYTTFFKANRAQETVAEEEAIGSSEARLELLRDSITTTFNHPLFGVGPGNFMVEQAAMATARGEPYGLWRVTHNSYTELSSETGIPGLLIYLAFLVQSWRVLGQILRKKQVSPEVMLMAQTLRASFLVLVTTAVSDSVAYDGNIPIMAGLITALSLIARDQRTRYTAQKKEKEEQEIAPEPYVPEYEPALTSPLYD